MNAIGEQISAILWNVFNRPRLIDLIDILLLTIIIYELLVHVRQTRVSQTIKGIIILLIATWLSDVLGMPIRVVGYAQTCALGAAMCAAVAAGIHPTVGEAQAAMGVREYVDYVPDPERRAYYERQYERYAALGRFVEQQTNEQ